VISLNFFPPSRLVLFSLVYIDNLLLLLQRLFIILPIMFSAENSSFSMLNNMGSKNACALVFACISGRNIKCSVIIIIILLLLLLLLVKYDLVLCFGNSSSFLYRKSYKLI